MKIAFIDTETTGLDPHENEVIEVAILVEDTATGLTTEFHTLVKPQRIETAHPKALEINGYAEAPERWAEAPLLGEVADEIQGMIDRYTFVVGQNVKFDLDFLKAGFQREGKRFFVNHRNVADTQTLAHEHLLPCGIPKLGMDTIREYLGWSTEGAHTALKDTHDTRRLYWTLVRANWFQRLCWRLRFSRINKRKSR